MNIVFLIGNGFDKNLGMNTAYPDFYKYYLNLPTDNDSDTIKTFKQELQEDLKNWSDLEFELGKYLANLNGKQAVELHRNLVDNLSKYIEQEEARYPFDKDQRGAFCEYLINPHKRRLLQTDALEVDTHMSRWGNSTWNVSLITFNYSKSVERLIQKSGKIGNRGSSDTNLTGIVHIHGYTDSRLILGVNDKSQIANEKLHSETRVTNRYVKSDCNSTYRLTHDVNCRQLISKANLICTFGLSFGETDRKWWEAVGDTLKGDCKMILFEYNQDIKFNGNQGPDQLEEEDAIKDRFLQRTNVEESMRDKIKKNIYVAYNTNMFKLDIGKKEEKEI
jgi:hypothetical protein